MEHGLTINMLLVGEARARLRNVAYRLPPLRSAASVPDRGDAIRLAGLESFTFAVVGRQWTYGANGQATLDLLLDLAAPPSEPKSSPLALVPPPTVPAPDE